ncbi:MAG TPA: hypothetical protein VGE57_04060 [Solimonas sp.]
MSKKVAVAAVLALAMSATTAHAFSFPGFGNFGCEKQLVVEKKRGPDAFSQFQRLFQQIFQQFFGCYRT